MALKDYIQLLFGIRNDIKNVIKEKFSVEQGKAETVTDDFTTYADFIAEMNYTPHIIQIRFKHHHSNAQLGPSTPSEQNIYNDDTDYVLSQPYSDCIGGVYSPGTASANSIEGIKFGAGASATNKGSASIRINFSEQYNIIPKSIEVVCWSYSSSDATTYLKVYDIVKSIPSPAATSDEEPENPETITFVPTNITEPVNYIDLTTTNSDGGLYATGAHRMYVKSILIRY